MLFGERKFAQAELDAAPRRGQLGARRTRNLLAREDVVTLLVLQYFAQSKCFIFFLWFLCITLETGPKMW